MAAPRRRSNAQPRRRRSPTVPSVEQIRREISGGSDAYDRIVLGSGKRPIPKPSFDEANDAASLSAKARAQRNMSYETALAIQEARSGDDTLLLPYQPTPSINPPRPRTLAAGYDPKTRTLRVRFRDGTPWEYYDVPQSVWRNFRRVKSPGRFINRTLNNYEYSRGNF